jgi:hypothetical protein
MALRCRRLSFDRYFTFSCDVGVVRFLGANMGLSLEVGSYANVMEDEELDLETQTAFEEDFEALNLVLAKAGLPLHQEPKKLEEAESFSCGMIGYRGLHYLRRIAIFLAHELPLPPPGPKYDEDREDPVAEKLLEKHYAYLESGNKYFNSKSNDAYLPFSHLILHGDADGIYLPQRFTTIQYFEDGSNVFGQVIGSAYTLLEECRKLALALEIPQDLDVDSNNSNLEIDDQGEGEKLWQRYAIETYTCVQLMRACEASIKTNSLVLFC